MGGVGRGGEEGGGGDERALTVHTPVGVVVASETLYTCALHSPVLVDERGRPFSADEGAAHGGTGSHLGHGQSFRRRASPRSTRRETVCGTASLAYSTHLLCPTPASVSVVPRAINSMVNNSMAPLRLCGVLAVLALLGVAAARVAQPDSALHSQKLSAELAVVRGGGWEPRRRVSEWGLPASGPPPPPGRPASRHALPRTRPAVRGASASQRRRRRPQERPGEAFALWQQAYGRSYKSASEASRRRAVFAANARHVAEHNARNSGLVLALNQFADLTFDEFAATHLGYQPSARKGCAQARRATATACCQWRQCAALGG